MWKAAGPPDLCVLVIGPLTACLKGAFSFLCVRLHSLTLSDQFLVHSAATADIADTGLQTPAGLGRTSALEASKGKLGFWILKLPLMSLAGSSFWEVQCEVNASKTAIISVKTVTGITTTTRVHG